jgi:hypothetical protein
MEDRGPASRPVRISVCNPDSVLAFEPDPLPVYSASQAV